MERFVFIFLFLGLLGVSFGAPLARFVPELAALAIAFWRMAGASLLLWSSAPLKPQGKLNKQEHFLIFIAGIFLALHFICFYSAVKLVPIANATLFATLAPLFTLIYERFVLRHRLPAGALAGLWLAIIGAVVIQGVSLNFGGSETFGNALALASSVFMSVVLIIAAHVRPAMSTVMYTRWLYLFAAVTLGLIAVFGGVNLGFGEADGKWLLALVILPTLMGHNSMRALP